MPASPTLVAWAPTENPDLLSLLATWAHPEQEPFNRDTLLSLLASGVQPLIDACDDPDEAATEFAHQLHSRQAWPFTGPQRAAGAADRLVRCNAFVEEALQSFGVPIDLAAWPIRESAAARELLLEDEIDTFDALMRWADHITRPHWHYSSAKDEDCP